MKKISGGVCAPKGFRAGGIWCGIKAARSKRDLALILSDTPCAASALYTTNRVKSAGIIITRENIAGGPLRGIIANSGNANACTGPDGMKHALRMTELAAAALGITPSELAVASTGVIGVPLPIAAIEAGIGPLADSLNDGEAGHDAALEAIMTTDTRKKEAACEIGLNGESGGTTVRFGAMLKGSGMIHPSLATMLCFITCDAAISRPLLEKALARAAAVSFNRVTVDGDTSTNDMVLILANGQAGNKAIEEEGPDYAAFVKALEELCVSLARAMARDGEGATRLISCTVRGAASEPDAEALAKAIVKSSLVKTAVFGADANWGRVLCAMGYSGAEFDPDTVDVRFASAAGEITVCRGGGPFPFSEERAKEILSAEEEIEILVDINAPGGKAVVESCTAWGCDLTYDYVRINGDYRS